MENNLGEQALHAAGSPPLAPGNEWVHSSEVLDINMFTAPKPKRPRGPLEILAWLAACTFLLYFGDSHHNCFHILLHNARIHLQPLLVGYLCLAVGGCIYLYLAVWCRHVARDRRSFDILAPGAVPTAILLGIGAFILFTYALWPVWGVLTLPILYVLFMGVVVVSPYLPPYVKLQHQD